MHGVDLFGCGAGGGGGGVGQKRALDPSLIDFHGEGWGGAGGASLQGMDISEVCTRDLG